MADSYKTGPDGVRRVRRLCRLSEDSTKDANAADDRSALPAVVTPEEWQTARDGLLVK
jgi:hypothetical protein